MLSLFVQAGACFDGHGTFVKCALEAVQCSEQQTFFSSRQVTREIQTRCEDPLKDMLALCEPSDGKSFCTAAPDACPTELLDVSGRSSSLLCSDGDHGLYGSCQMDRTVPAVCHWSKQEACTGSTALWKDADENCSCDKVETGACQDTIDPDVFHCAVSPNACDQGSRFVTAQGIRELGYKCNLCSSEGTTTEQRRLRPRVGPSGTSSRLPLARTQQDVIIGGKGAAKMSQIGYRQASCR